MELVKLEKRLKCDIGGCKNYATYSVRHERGNFSNHLNLCEDCLKEMYSLFAKTVVPEALPAVFSGKRKTGKGGAV